jgi:D-sedoheptulose 7-phosphate isomerase
MAMNRDGMRAKIEERLADAAYTKLLFLESAAPALESIARLLVKALKGGRRVYLFGNGGSAADAQHIAAEMEGRFHKERRPWPVLALTTNTSTLTAIANDYDFETTFPRLVEAHARRGDVVIAISTSGNSPNVVGAAKQARKMGVSVVGFTGEKGGKLKGLADVCLCAPSTVTARIQECHITAGHILCEMLEEALPR